MAKVLPKTLNLLSPTAAPKNTWDKIYDWVFSAGRIIIIAVEAIVLMAFASRFYFDRRNNDLKDSIEAKIEMLDAQQEFEVKIRKIQNVLGEVSTNIKKQYPMSGELQNVLDKIPASVNVDSFAVTQLSVAMTCHAPNYDVVEDLETGFKSDPTYTDVNVTLSKTGSDEVNFTLNLNFATEQSQTDGSSNL